jgi:hypothetical protein
MLAGCELASMAEVTTVTGVGAASPFRTAREPVTTISATAAGDGVSAG